MMYIRKQNKNKKRLFILITVAVILVAGAGAGLYWWQYAFNTRSDDTNINYGPPTEEEKESAAQKKQEVIEKQTQPENNTSPVPPGANSLTLTITRVNQGGTGQPVYVRTIVEGAASGTCRAVFTRDQSTVTKEFTISFDGTLVSCNGDINAGEFSADGEWSLAITAHHGNLTSEPAQTKVTVAR